MIKNIVFDMGQVLIEFNPEEFVKHLGYKNKEEIDYIVEYIYKSDIWKKMDEGTIQFNDGYNMFLNTISEKYKESVDALVNKWWGLKDPIKGMLDLVRQLYEKGYNLYLLSNASTAAIDFWQELPYKAYFKGLYISSLHKKLKPNREIYEDFINEFKLNKEECIFIDDTKANVDAANDFGIKSHVFVGAEELIEYLKNQKII